LGRVEWATSRPFWDAPMQGRQTDRSCAFGARRVGDLSPFLGCTHGRQTDRSALRGAGSRDSGPHRLQARCQLRRELGGLGLLGGLGPRDRLRLLRLPGPPVGLGFPVHVRGWERDGQATEKFMLPCHASWFRVQSLGFGVQKPGSRLRRVALHSRRLHASQNALDPIWHAYHDTGNEKHYAL
jgi:hypothetical protein